MECGTVEHTVEVRSSSGQKVEGSVWKWDMADGARFSVSTADLLKFKHQNLPVFGLKYRVAPAQLIKP